MPQDRYENVEEIILELENYLKGIPEWVLTHTLSVKEKTDWEFQENILLSKHIAISGQGEALQWVGLMISSHSFSGNIKIETEVSLGKNGQGIGFLLNIPETSERKKLEEGYCLWLGKEQDSRLFRNNIEVMQFKTPELPKSGSYVIAIEKIEDHLRFYVDGVLQCHYISHTPLRGDHIGLLSKDADFTIKPIKVFTSSQNLMVSCLAIPDAFLANNAYEKALSEYRRIASSFPGRSEASEALFRAGVTLIEQAVASKNKRLRQHMLLSAQEEFSKLRNTPGAPLEYLGKSLVYKAENDIEEELKCLELAIRKYTKHPLLTRLHDQIIFRLHESASQDRISAYHFALLALRQLPHIFVIQDNQNLLDSLRKHCPPLSFIDDAAPGDISLQNANLAIQLAFWLAKPITLVEVIESYPSHQTLHMSALIALLKLGYVRWAEETAAGLSKDLSSLLSIAHFAEKNISTAIENLLNADQISFWHKQLCIYLFEKAITENKTSDAIPFFSKIPAKALSKKDKEELTLLHIECLLWEKDQKNAKKLLESFGWNKIQEDDSPFYDLFLCYLVKEKGRAHVKKYLAESKPKWFELMQKPLALKQYLKTALLWEAIQTLRKLALYAHCANDKPLKKQFQSYLQKLTKPKI